MCKAIKFYYSFQYNAWVKFVKYLWYKYSSTNCLRFTINGIDWFTITGYSKKYIYYYFYGKQYKVHTNDVTTIIRIID